MRTDRSDVEIFDPMRFATEEDSGQEVSGQVSSVKNLSHTV